MKTVILAGGRGMRLSEETGMRPKPMVEIGGRPILWHIMKIYSHYGFNDFVICLGYLGNVIKDYFLNYLTRHHSFSIRLDTGVIDYHSAKTEVEPWRVLLLDTGLEAGTADRVLAAEPYLDGDTFMLTYGDGVADIDIRKLVAYHKSQQKLVTMSVAKPDNKYGVVTVEPDGQVSNFREKPRDDGWSNCGFFVFNKKALVYLRGHQYLESEPMMQLIRAQELNAYQHSGYFQSMDTMREKLILEEQWAKKPPWRVWG